MEKLQGYGLFVLRILIAARLIWGVQDNILSWDHMVEFEKFLAQRGTPMPLVAAVVSVYVQFICGLLILFGAFIRWASIPLIINFIAALIIAHRGDSFVGMFPALTMLTAGIVFFCEGAGKISIDEYLRSRK